jgi:hypothetical protein
VLRQWRPPELQGRRSLLVTIETALVRCHEAWEIREDRYTDPDDRFFGVFVRHPVAEDAIEIGTFLLERARTETLLTRLRASRIVALPTDYPSGLDGTSFELQIADHFVDIRLRWWEAGPGLWHPVVSGMQELLSFLKESRARYMSTRS